jgi:hypothetical protein
MTPQLSFVRTKVQKTASLTAKCQMIPGSWLEKARKVISGICHTAVTKFDFKKTRNVKERIRDTIRLIGKNHKGK